MPTTFSFACPVGHQFDARVSMLAREAECPACGATAAKQFTLPGVAQICVPTHMGTTRYDFLPRSGTGLRETPEFLAGKLLAEHDDRMMAQQEKAAGVETFGKFFERTNPDVNLASPALKTEPLAPNALTKAYEKATS